MGGGRHRTIDYYERVIKMFHGTEQVQRFARLFMAPGVFHCGGGTGPQVFDSLGALVRWVETGEAPDRITASRVENGVVVRTRPLCAYPYFARHDGTGGPNSAESFDCKPNFGQGSPRNDTSSRDGSGPNRELGPDPDHGQISSATSTISASFATCSS
jgi:Tannase and feruloyl esterase